MNSVLDDSNIKSALETFAKGDNNSSEGLPDLAAICEKDKVALGNPELISAILEIAKEKSPHVIKQIAGFVRGHVRASQNLRKTGRELVIKLTGMEKNDYFTGKRPVDIKTSGNSEVTQRQNLALQIMGPAFLEDNVEHRFQRLGQIWDEATKISFAEEIGIADEYLFSLGRWFTGLALNCEHTLSKQHAKIIVENVRRINEIVSEHHYHSVRIPGFLFERAGLDVHENDEVLAATPL